MPLDMGRQLQPQLEVEAAAAFVVVAVVLLYPNFCSCPSPHMRITNGPLLKFIALTLRGGGRGVPMHFKYK